MKSQSQFDLWAVKSISKRDKTRTGSRGLSSLFVLWSGPEHSSSGRNVLIWHVMSLDWRFLSLSAHGRRHVGALVRSGLLLDDEVAQDHSLSSRLQRPGLPSGCLQLAGERGSER